MHLPSDPTASLTGIPRAADQASGEAKEDQSPLRSVPIFHMRADKYPKHTLLLHNVSGLRSCREEAAATALLHIITRQVSKDDVNGTESEC